MRRRLEVWMEQTDDPLRRGPIPFPPHGKSNTHQMRSGSEPAVEGDQFDPAHP